MRILVHECVSGGGRAGLPVSASLAREGAAMREALVADLAALGRHRIVTTADRRFPLRNVPRGVEVVVLPPGNDGLLDGLLASVDAAWLIAPETGGVLEALASRAESHGATLLGSRADAIRRASDKSRLPALLARAGVPHPETRVVSSDEDARGVAAVLGLPMVLKPAQGAGAAGVSLVRRRREIGPAVAAARRAAAGGRLLAQRYVPGAAASVSLLADGRRTAVLAVNGQSLGSPAFAYRGGVTPLRHPLADRASMNARRACEAIPGLRGYVGIDVVLSEGDAVVIEVNPRLTTAYLGVRAVTDENVAGLTLAACTGRLPKALRVRRQAHFTSAGRILQTLGPRPVE
jgi:predicted ATP-grasp superfamily ATP-dependent carboligase